MGTRLSATTKLPRHLICMSCHYATCISWPVLTDICMQLFGKETLLHIDLGAGGYKINTPSVMYGSSRNWKQDITSIVKEWWLLVTNCVCNSYITCNFPGSIFPTITQRWFIKIRSRKHNVRPFHSTLNACSFDSECQSQSKHTTDGECGMIETNKNKLSSIKY